MHGCVCWLQALQEIVSRGADPANIRVVAVVAAPPALKLMADTYPGESGPAQAAAEHVTGAVMVARGTAVVAVLRKQLWLSNAVCVSVCLAAARRLVDMRCTFV